MRTIHTKLTKLISGILFSGFLISLYSGTLPVYAEEIRTSVDLIAEIEPTLQVVVPTGISLNLTPNLDGSPVFVSRDLNILVATNNPTGYHLSLQTNSTNLTNNVKDKDGNYPILETISSELSEADFTVNRWGYKYNTANYLPFQTNINLNQTTNPTNEDNITLTFGAKADITKPAGTYSLALNFHAVTNMIPGVETIIFNGNGATGGSMASQQIEAGTSANLNNNQFTRIDYTFLYWNTEPNGNGITYTDKQLQNVTLSANNTSLNLYAQWASNYMQDFTLANCKTLATDNSHTLIDRRDNNDYTVRYIEGNCWMTRNLNFVLVAEMILKPETTNVREEVKIGEVGSLSSGTLYDKVLMQAGDNSSEKYYGYYYNYCAATVGGICSNDNAETAFYDVCPRGWEMPSVNQSLTLTGEDSNSWTTTYIDAFSPNLAGSFSGMLRDDGTRGYWWLKTASDENNRHVLHYWTERGLWTRNLAANNGYSVRCVRKN